MLRTYGRLLALGAWLGAWFTTNVPLLRWFRARRGDDAGEGPLGFIVIAAAIFLLAIAVAAKITQVVNEHMAKIK